MVVEKMARKKWMIKKKAEGKNGRQFSALPCINQSPTVILSNFNFTVIFCQLLTFLLKKCFFTLFGLLSNLIFEPISSESFYETNYLCFLKLLVFAFDFRAGTLEGEGKGPFFPSAIFSIDIFFGYPFFQFLLRFDLHDFF